MSSAAHSIAGAEFHTEYMGEPALKGVDEPLGVFRADRSRGSNEGPVLEAAFAAPLVGRDRELDQLLVAWNGAKQGIGRTVVMSGEPGVGKSRLLATLREQVEAMNSAGWSCAAPSLPSTRPSVRSPTWSGEQQAYPSTATRTSSDAGFATSCLRRWGKRGT